MDAPDIEFSDPCLGSVGSQPFLHDVQAQLNENFQANREGRAPNILPIQCGFCQGHHEANQLDAATVFPGTDFDAYAYNRIAPPGPSDTYASEDLLTIARESLIPGTIEEVTDGSE